MGEKMKNLRLDFELVQYLEKRDTDMNEHIMTLYQTAKGVSPKVIVELGAGQSTYALAVAAIETGAKFYSIDISPLGDEHAVLRGFEEGKGLLDGLPEYIAIQGDSIEVGKTWSKKTDFLLIDTDHTYERTKVELEIWPQYVRVGGKIAMHDTVSQDVNCGVKKALDEFLQNNKEYSVINYSDTKRIGLSVLTKH